MQSKATKTTSFQDLIRNFKQAESHPQPQDNKPKTKQLILKKLTRFPENKENHIERGHVQSMFEKVRETTECSEEEVLKEYNRKRKGRQLELTYHKFITEATGVLTGLLGISPPELLPLKLNYVQFLSALQEMAFIRESYQPTPHDLVTQLWSEVTRNGQTAGVLILATAAILNLGSSQEHAQQLQHYWHKYSDLRYVRLETLGKTKTVHDEADDHPFSPMISQRSRTMATSRSKSKRKDRCFAQKSCHQSDEDQGLTERSQRYSESDRIQYDPQTGNKRSQILYQMARERSAEKRRDRDRGEIEYQKSKKQLTFHPKIHPNTKEQVRRKTIQGQQDSIDRMLRGRVERQVRRILKEKGIPYNEKMFQRMKKQRYEALLKPQPSPQQIIDLKQTVDACQIEQKRSEGTPMVLSVEVEEGRIQKLVIREGEDYREVASRFIQEFGLNRQLEERLVGGIEKALRCQLTQIDEDSFESEMESIP